MIAQGPRGRLQARRSAGRHRQVARRRRVAGRRSFPSHRLRTLIALVAVLLLLGGAWLWLRDSSLVAVKHVSIRGASGPDAGQIRSALRAAASNMTTLDVQMGQLRSAVSPYPVVKDLRVSTHFPHGMTIRVIEQDPVGAVVVDGQATAVSGDGTLIHDVASLRVAAADPAQGRPRRQAPHRPRRAWGGETACPPRPANSSRESARSRRSHRTGSSLRSGTVRASTSATLDGSTRSGPRWRPCSPIRARPVRCTSTSPTRSVRPLGPGHLPTAARARPGRPRSARPHRRIRVPRPARARRPRLEGKALNKAKGSGHVALNLRSSLRRSNWQVSATRRDFGDLQRSLRCGGSR